MGSCMSADRHSCSERPEDAPAQDPPTSGPLYGPDYLAYHADILIPEPFRPPWQARFTRFTGPLWPLWWYLEWAIPGLGMFTEAYITFSAGQLRPFQQALWPGCFTLYDDCDAHTVNNLAGYIQACGIMAGMLLWGVLGDYKGRRWGSCCVALIMLSGSLLLTFTPWASSPYGYWCFFVTAQTWFGFGAGGEYPMAAASAVERSATTPDLRQLRAQHAILVFSNQCMGNLTNAVVVLICMAIFGATQASDPAVTDPDPAASPVSTTTLDRTSARNILALTYGCGCFACLVVAAYRLLFLWESEMYREEEKIEQELHVGPGTSLGVRKQLVSLRRYWPRLCGACVTWFANDFAFYGVHLQQHVFLSALYPTASLFKKQQWILLNLSISLLGSYTAAALCDKRWYGRLRCQCIGFTALFILYITIYAQWTNMAAPCLSSSQQDQALPAPSCASLSGARAFQALFYLSSFFTQFGPSATTWLISAEAFPTDIRATYHGSAACMGKLGAVLSALWVSTLDSSKLTGRGSVRMVFLASAIWALGAVLLTWLLLPDTTGLDLEENDRMQRFLLEHPQRIQDYHGEAINPRHLSIWEIYVLGWHKRFNLKEDRHQFEMELDEYAQRYQLDLFRGVPPVVTGVMPSGPAQWMGSWRRPAGLEGVESAGG